MAGGRWPSACVENGFLHPVRATDRAAENYFFDAPWRSNGPAARSSAAWSGLFSAAWAMLESLP